MLRVRDERALNALIRGRTPEPPKKRQAVGMATPESLLTDALIARFGSAVKPQYRGAVPGRRYVLDAAMPEYRLAIEIDGWQFHGKYLKDFTRDRQRDRALVLNGWRVLRFTAGEVRADPDGCVSIVAQCLGV